MKVKLSILLLCNTIFAICNASPVCYHLYGQTSCGKGHIKEVNASGLVHLKQTSIDKVALIQGDLNATDAILATTSVQGHALLKRTKILGPMLVIGDLECTDCQFRKPIILVSNHAFFNRSHLTDVTIKDSHEYRQTVILQGASVVAGNIVFASHKGLVQYCQQSQIKGKIIGGTSQKIKCKPVKT